MIETSRVARICVFIMAVSGPYSPAQNDVSCIKERPVNGRNGKTTKSTNQASNGYYKVSILKFLNAFSKCHVLRLRAPPLRLNVYLHYAV